jgi:hypothetical protein
MPSKRGTDRASGDPNPIFSQELKGETPPTLPTLAGLYDLATKICIAKPWTLLEESALVLTSDPVTGETCYCGVTGELGESITVRAYIGSESYRLFAALWMRIRSAAMSSSPGSTASGWSSSAGRNWRRRTRDC